MLHRPGRWGQPAPGTCHTHRKDPAHVTEPIIAKGLSGVPPRWRVRGAMSPPSTSTMLCIQSIAAPLEPPPLPSPPESSAGLEHGAGSAWMPNETIKPPAGKLVISHPAKGNGRLQKKHRRIVMRKGPGALAARAPCLSWSPRLLRPSVPPVGHRINASAPERFPASWGIRAARDLAITVFLATNY